MDTQEARILTAIIIAGIVLGIIIVYFTISMVRQQKRNLKLQQASILAEISAMEKERARIANDLHDDVGPILSVIKFQVDGVTCIDEEDTQDLQNAVQQIDGLISRMREISNNLMPSVLLRKGLVPAIQEYVNKIGATTGMETRFSHEVTSPLSQDQQINIYRIMQETVHNAVKHSGAKKLEVSLAEKGSFYHLLVKDNGRGFDYSIMKDESTGFGLRSLKNRVELIGGNMIVETKKGIGSAFLFEIPTGRS